MADRIMVDTNVLLYAYDRGEPSKQPQALAVLDYLVINRLGVLDFSGATLSEVQFSCDV
jgi:predicted nucleic acid-binding protein